MCKIHTETLYVRCGHGFFTQTMENDVPCINIDRYSMATNKRSLCPWCLGVPAAERVLEDVNGVRLDWERRVREWNEACEATNIERGVENRLSMFEAIGDGTWIPLYYMADRSEVTAPELLVIAPGTIPEDSDRCGVCYGSLTSLEPDEWCEGYGARKLPCGHFFGRRCLQSTFDIGQEEDGPPKARCPYCQRQFLVTSNSKTSEVSFFYASLAHYFSTYPRFGPIIGGYPVFTLMGHILIYPYVCVVGISMEIAAKLNIRRRHRFRTTPRWIRLLLAVIGLGVWHLITCLLTYILYALGRFMIPGVVGSFQYLHIIAAVQVPVYFLFYYILADVLGIWG